MIPYQEFETWVECMHALRVPYDTPLTPGGKPFTINHYNLTMKIVKTPALSDFPTI